MVAKRHKITNVPLFKKIWDIIYFFGTITFWAISWDILRGPRLFWLSNVPWNGSKSDCPAQKKIMSRSFLNSGTLIVTVYGPRSLKSKFSQGRFFIAFSRMSGFDAVTQCTFLIIELLQCPSPYSKYLWNEQFGSLSSGRRQKNLKYFWQKMCKQFC